MSVRDTKQLLKGVAAKLSGKSRGPDQQVRRSSYDVDDPRAQVFRPIADGTVAGGLGWTDDLLRTAEEFDVLGRKDASRGPLTPYGIAVLRALLKGNQLDFKTGRLEPAIAWIETVTGFARKTVVDALARLRRHGFLNWVRRTRRTESAGDGAGPQREQVTNAYFFDVSGMAKHVLQRFRDLRERRRRRAANQAITSAAAAPAIRDPDLASALDRLGKLIPGASTA